MYTGCVKSYLIYLPRLHWLCAHCVQVVVVGLLVFTWTCSGLLD